jgi:excinuclease ABC subunit C
MRLGEIIYLILFQVEKGTLTGKEEFIFNSSEDFLEEFIIQYYSNVKPPKELIMPYFPDAVIEDYLTHLRGSHVTITIPKQGEKKELLELVLKNIEASFFRGKLRIAELGEVLHLNNPPEVIECFDISHLGGTGTVGSMVSFRDGKPDKSNYRRYKIKIADPSNDYAAIREIVKRRYSRLIQEKKDLPDLIIIDGGQGQLHSAKEILDELGISVPLISIAKREEEIFRAGDPRPLGIPRKNPASLIVQEIRDEAHRFAITYQKKLRQKRILE